MSWVLILCALSALLGKYCLTDAAIEVFRNGLSALVVEYFLCLLLPWFPSTWLRELIRYAGRQHVIAATEAAALAGLQSGNSVFNTLAPNVQPPGIGNGPPPVGENSAAATDADYLARLEAGLGDDVPDPPIPKTKPPFDIGDGPPPVEENSRFVSKIITSVRLFIMGNRVDAQNDDLCEDYKDE